MVAIRRRSWGFFNLHRSQDLSYLSLCRIDDGGNRNEIFHHSEQAKTDPC